MASGGGVAVRMLRGAQPLRAGGGNPAAGEVHRGRGAGGRTLAGGVRVRCRGAAPEELRLKCKVPLSELPANNIANVSLLLVTLIAAGGSQLAKVSLPVQVVEDGDRYVRTILAPSL
eukprot:jgi/Tetstr1/434287/TSEL_023394.t1